MEEQARRFLAELELESGANFDDVKKAYHDLLIIWHPDKHPERVKDRANEKTKNIIYAYEWLCKNKSFLDELSKKQKNDVSKIIIKCSKCKTKNRIDSYFPEIDSRQYTCKACNEFLFLFIKCNGCHTEHRIDQNQETGCYSCNICNSDKLLFGVIKCKKCDTRNCITHYTTSAPLCAKCKESLLEEDSKGLSFGVIAAGVAGAVLALLGSLG